MAMNTALATKPMTAEEFYEWVHRPENADRWFELVRGEVIELPPPTKPHGGVCINVGYHLENYVRQRQAGYVTCNDSGVILGREPDTVRGPDVALYDDASSFDELHPKYGEVPPRLAVEVLSPNDKAAKVVSKTTNYINSGVELVWLIDPDDRTVTVYRPKENPYELKGDAELTGDAVLPGFRCRVADFFYVPGEKAKDASSPT
jgi:Uma2 family endonuclease